MSKTLIVVEFKNEAEFYVHSHRDLMSSGAIVLSLLPEASEVFIKHGIAFTNTVGYFPKSSHERCLQAVDGIMHAVGHVSVIKDAYGIEHAYVNTLTFYLRQYISYVVFVIETIANCLKTHQPETVNTVFYKNNDDASWSLTDRERILGEILRLFGNDVTIDGPVLDVPSEDVSAYHRRWMRRVCSRVYYEMEMYAAKFLSRPVLGFYSLKYNFDALARAFNDHAIYNFGPDRKSLTKMQDRSHGFLVNNVHIHEASFTRDGIFHDSWHNTLANIRKAHEDKQIFSYRGIDFSSLIFRKLEGGYAKNMAGLNRRVSLLDRFLRRVKPVVVISPMAREFSYALGEMARRLNIPSVLISHGSHVPPHNVYENMEWRDHGKGMVHTDYQYHLLQSPWAVEHVRAMGYQGNYYAVKPFIFPTVNRADKELRQSQMFPQSQGKKIILHAGTPKPRGSNRFYIYETIDEYVQYMKDLIEQTRELQDAFLVIRFRPYPYLNEAQLKALLPSGDHYVIASDGSFADFLKIADLMVSFSSTTIEEALINGIPVLQYDASDRYVHIEGARWTDKGFARADSVYYIGDRATLPAALRWIIDRHLNATIVGDLFERHTFDADEAISVEEFLKRLIKNDLPRPINLHEQKHVTREMF